MLQYFDTLTDDSGNALLGATIAVTAYPGGGAVTIYSSNGTIAPIANATVAADITGQVSFFAPDGAYILTYAYKGTQYKVRSPVQFLDPMGFVAATDAGVAPNAYVVTAQQYPAQKYVGLKLELLAANTNTAASTLTFQGDGGFPIRQPGGSGLAPGMIQQNGLVRVEWDGTQWQLIGSQSQPFYAQSLAEQAASVTPTNTSYPYGSLLRYGADPTGAADSSTAIANAIKCNSAVFDDYPGGGTYLINQDLVVSRYPIRISGSEATLGSGTGGTVFKVTTAAGAGAAALHFNAFAVGVVIERISFQWQTVTLTQYGIRSTSDFRFATIRDCSFINTTGTVNPGVIAISLESPAVFSGEVTIRDNYIAGTKIAVNMSGACTTVRICQNAIYGNLTGTTIGVSAAFSGGGGGATVIGNTFEGWSTTGISAAGGPVMQALNYFEGNGPSNQVDWIWTGTNNVSLGEFNTTGGGATYTYNNTTANIVIDSTRAGLFVDSQAFNAYRGFTELGLSTPMGYGTTPTFAAGNFGVNTGGPWTVIAGGVTTFTYSRKGGEMTVCFSVSGTLTGGTTVALTIAIPGGFFPAVNITNPVVVTNGGANAFGFAQVTTSAALINIYRDATGSAAWTAGTVAVQGQITFRIIS